MFERFGKDARRAVLEALRLADQQGTQVGASHLLLAVVGDRTGAGARLLAQYGVRARHVRVALAAGTRRAGLSDADVAALRALGIDADEVLRRLTRSLDGPGLAAPLARPRRWHGLGGPFDASAAGILALSVREADVAGHDRVGTEHLLLALLQHIEAAAPWVPAPLSTLLAEQAVGYDGIRRRVHRHRVHRQRVYRAGGQRRAG